MCGIHSGQVRFTRVTEFSDFMLEFNRKTLEAQGMKHRILSREQSSLLGGEPVVDVLVDIVPGGRSRRLFVLHRDTGIVVDCENYVQNWPLVEGHYDAIISSFALEQ